MKYFFFGRFMHKPRKERRLFLPAVKIKVKFKLCSVYFFVYDVLGYEAKLLARSCQSCMHTHTALDYSACMATSMSWKRIVKGKTQPNGGCLFSSHSLVSSTRLSC